ncbi:MAG: class I SAM-dependent methyltransferase [Nitrospinae bacterium]|nr:class I SAM-dependent methyltransferase [Nitrospinota bacterium]MBF0635340.1 class I SAM-dependent methyltransferase [Nitrospinota bacterium]
MSGDNNAASDTSFDPAQAAERIKERVRQKIADGVYDDKEIKKLEELNMRLYERSAQIGHGAHYDGEAIGFMDQNWDVTAPIQVVSPRGGIVTIFKKFYQKTFHRLMRPSLSRQADFNSRVIRVARGAFDELLYLRRRYVELAERMAGIEKVYDELEGRTRRLETLPAQVESLGKTLRDIDRQGIFLKNRLTEILEKVSGADIGEVSKSAAKEKSKLAAHDYTLFENLHRGSREEIKKRLSVYAGWFNVYAGWYKGADAVLDVGCGRGELLEILHEAGIRAIGVDINEEMVEQCKRRGLSATAGDAIEYLESLDDASLGGIGAIQFIEHLPVETMTRFFQLAFDKLKPGGVIAAETINPACLTTFCGAFYLDMSHSKPVHPMAVRFLLERIGFSEVRIEYLNPYPENMRLKPIPLAKIGLWPDPALAVEYNSNLDKLNGILYSHTDYAVVARR